MYTYKQHFWELDENGKLVPLCRCRVGFHLSNTPCKKCLTLKKQTTDKV